MSNHVNQLGLSTPLFWWSLHPPLPFIIIIQTKSRYSFLVAGWV